MVSRTLDAVGVQAGDFNEMKQTLTVRYENWAWGARFDRIS
ncbi:hypothetical protein [Microcoleus sp.]